MKQLTLAALFALFANAALAQTPDISASAEYTRGAAACDATETEPQVSQASPLPGQLATAKGMAQSSELSCPYNPDNLFCPEAE